MVTVAYALATAIRTVSPGAAETELASLARSIVADSTVVADDISTANATAKAAAMASADAPILVT